MYVIKYAWKSIIRNKGRNILLIIIALVIAVSACVSLSMFVCELLIVTFTAIVIGVAIGAAVSVPVTNTLLKQQIEKAEASDEKVSGNFGMQGASLGRFGSMLSERFGAGNTSDDNVSYVATVSSATDLTVILQMLLVGLFLTVISSLAAMVSIMRYEPLQILADRS